MRPSENAAQYLNQREKPGNSGFLDPCFEIEMREDGWQTGWAWCSVFAKVVYKNCFPEHKELDKLFSASAVQTFKNFRDAGYLIGHVPQIDSLVIWQNMKDGKPQWTGHAGIVSKVIDQETFESIEGNTNNDGSREGVMVVERTRKVIPDVKNGLKVMGFVQINGTSELKLTR